MLPLARRATLEVARFHSEAEALRGKLAGTVAIGLPGSVAARLVAPLVTESRLRFPELSLDVKPRRGSALYFEYRNAAGELDARCLHAGVPVIQGEKWIATKWLRQGPYQR